ncbi:MAG: hypothetical protein KA143_11420, partial [Saprospiraceae bacterium]|nr:hypothetical protein [Saprospiraceae bacterium]
MGKYSAVKADLDKSGSEVTVNSQLKNVQGTIHPIGSTIKRTTRVKRNQSISYLQADEASQFAIDKNIKSFELNGDTIPFNRVQHAEGKNHHISEITALRPDGLRYIYGIPAYNRIQHEVAFAVKNNSSDCNTGLVTYDIHSGIVPKHEYKDSRVSKDDYLDIETTPAFAHSYLLTNILSEDYVDRFGDGPTPDDLGTYTKINYTKLHGNYKWRVPYQHANHNAGFQSQTNDDKGNFTYGEKEIWLIHSIESKTQYAEFMYSDRRDSHGVADFHGGRDNSMNLKKLDKIVLYSLPDKINNVPAQRTPIKSVHFVYDYSLCKNVPTNNETPENVYTYDINGTTTSTTNINADKGKLTLKKVYFKYGKSDKAQFSPYTFEYSSVNPDYHIKGYNRWGSYAPINLISNNNNSQSCTNISKITSSEFTWIKQESYGGNERALIDDYVSAWSLNKIHLPSGGLIQVDYEADDYGYIQDKQAMQLFEVIGTNTSSIYSSTSSSTLDLWSQSGSTKTPNNYLFFNLARSIPAGEDFRNHIFTHYLQQVIGHDLFFKVYIDLKSDGTYEYVQGYADVEDFGAVSSTVGFVKLKNVCTKDKDPSPSGGVCPGNSKLAHPISKTAWQFARLNLPHLAFGSAELSENENDFFSIGDAFMSMWDSMKSLFNGGVNNNMLDKDFAKKIVKGKSWIRLNNPFGNKYAGTHRVKRITISDEWSEMTNNVHTSSQYGQEYSYTKVDKINGIPFEYSSGVASFEPIIGSEDSPFRVPIQAYSDEVKMAPDNDHYVEGPIGESLYPSPHIVYSKVKISNLKYAGVTKKATGHTEHEFYTAKDFPVKTEATTLTAYPKKTNPILKILKIKNQDYMTTSQGYAIELNDMHGKSKSKSVFNETGTKISSVEYQYKRTVFGLNSNVSLLLPNGSLQQGVIGVDYNAILDQREAKNTTTGIGVNLNNDNFMLGFIPVPSFVPLPFYSKEKTKYRSLVITKIIHRTGILDKTIAYDLGSTIETRNLAWDGITGEVLCTQTFNEFEDPIYNFNYPAHWVYKGMQNAYKNINAGYTCTISAGTASGSGLSGHVLTEGDEVALNGSSKAWVKSVGTSSAELIDFNGNPIVGSGPATLKIIRSGHRNKAATSIGSFVSLVNPLTTVGFASTGNSRVINATAIEFDDKRNVPCCEDQSNT